MPYQPGHPFYPSKLPKVNSVAARQRTTLARYLNEAISEEEIYHWLRTVAAGKDPDAKEGELQGPPPDMATRVKAMSMILDRRDGRPTEHHIIQQELRASIGVASIAATPENLAALEPEKKRQLRALLREIAAPAQRDIAVQTVIDSARAREEKNDE